MGHPRKTETPREQGTWLVRRSETVHLRSSAPTQAKLGWGTHAKLRRRLSRARGWSEIGDCAFTEFRSHPSKAWMGHPRKTETPREQGTRLVGNRRLCICGVPPPPKQSLDPPHRPRPISTPASKNRTLGTPVSVGTPGMGHPRNIWRRFCLRRRERQAYKHLTIN